MSEVKNDLDYVMSSCQHCSGHIKFRKKDLAPGESRTVECPHCKLETLIYRPKDEGPKPESPKPTQKEPAGKSSSAFELFLFQLTRLPLVIVAMLALVGLIVFGIKFAIALAPVGPKPVVKVSFSLVNPRTAEAKSESGSSGPITDGKKMASKTTFPPNVLDFLVHHEGYSLKPYLDRIGYGHKSDYLSNLNTVLEEAKTKSLGDSELVTMVGNFSDLWIDMNENDDVATRNKARDAEINQCLYICLGLMLSLMIFSLILVLMAIERNTRRLIP